jgi:hypothetical protein
MEPYGKKNKITLFGLIICFIVLYGIWKTYKIDSISDMECKELIFFRYNTSYTEIYPVSYQTILYKKEKGVIYQVSYRGMLRVFHDILNYKLYPDTAGGGRIEYGYLRGTGFSKYKFSMDTLRMFYLADNPVYLEEQDSLQSDPYHYPILFERNINDTVFNGIYRVKNCKKYLAHDFDGLIHSLYVDVDKCIIIQFDNKANENVIDYYACTYKIVSERDISESYFIEVWEKSEQVNKLNFNLSACGT